MENMVPKDYLDPEGYWTDPDDNIHRMSGEQDIIGKVIGRSVRLNPVVCSYAELQKLKLSDVSDIGKKRK